MNESPLELTLQHRVKEAWAKLAPAERKVAAYLRDHLEDVPFASASDLGEATGTSDATVVRTAKALGYSGLAALKHEAGRRVAAMVRPSDRLRARIERLAGDPGELLDRVFEDAVEVLRETRTALRADGLTRAAETLAAAREVIAYGVGPSGIAADYLALRLTRLGLKARSSSDTGFRFADLVVPIGAGDVIVLFAPARLFSELEVLLDRAEAVGAKVVLVTDSLGPVLGPRAVATLLATLSATGATREMLASIAVIDALALAVASRLGDRAVAASALLDEVRMSFIEDGTSGKPD
ncbi:MurR/RpiR family transcriptional regulator [Nonomuraea sp. NPDC050153]|uniref:MurR/RpiR family transcriptional regulator n=1 Tax=Nonomuraea sp. NPDC050153 TaxID=3364359 RepID=UPI0037A1BD5F